MRILTRSFQPLFTKLTTEFDLLGGFLEIMANPADSFALDAKVNDIKDEFPEGYANLLMIEIITSGTKMHVICKKFKHLAEKRTTTAILVNNITTKVKILTESMRNTNKKIQIFMKKRNITREDGL